MRGPARSEMDPPPPPHAPRISVARADDDFAQVERDHIVKLLDFLRLEGDERAEVVALMDAPESPALPDTSMLPAYDARLYVFQHALLIAFADGLIRDDERTRIEQLAEVFELKPEDVERGWQRAREMHMP